MQKGSVGVFILIGILLVGLGVTGAWYMRIIEIPGFPPLGCYYQKVQCIKAPCNPILVCDTPSSNGVITSQTTPSSAPSVSPAPNGTGETANPDFIGVNWKTYRNERYGFEVKYPPNLNAHEYSAISRDSESEFWLILNKQPRLAKDTEITIYYPWKDISYIDKGLYIVVTPKEWVQIDKPDYTCRECVASFKNQQTTFASIKATKSVAEFPNDSSVNEGLQPYTYLIFNYRGKGWSIAYDHADFKGNYDPLYDQILSTFKFIN